MHADLTSNHTARRLCLPLFVAFLLVVLPACTRTSFSGKPIDATTAATAGTPDVTPGEVRLVAPGMPVLDAVPERPLYTMNVTLDYAGNNVHAQEKVEFQNPTGAPTTEIKFNVALNHRPDVIDVRDARIFGQPEPLTFVLSNTVLTVKLPGPLAPGDGIALAFDFVIRIPVQEAINGIGGDDSSHGTNSLTGGHWYIMLAPFYDGNWDTPAYVPVGDPYAEGLADYEVSFLAPENIVIAGAGDEQHEGRLWRFTLKKARVFAFSASDVYKVDQLEQNGITYIVYSYPAHQKFADSILITAARAVALYTQLYGPYLYKVLRIVETGRAQGQEYSGLVGLGTTLYAGYPGHGSRHDLIATTAHEVAHQWWFQQVGNKQARTPWLDESFARLSEWRFYQKYYPNDVNWWYRFYIVGAREPRGTLGVDLSITAFPDARTYMEAIYRRGLIFLHDVRGKVGTEDFDAAMRDYYTSVLYKVATQDAFFDALARHTNVNLTMLVNGYFASDVTLPCRISNNAVGCRN